MDAVKQPEYIEEKRVCLWEDVVFRHFSSEVCVRECASVEKCVAISGKTCLKGPFGISFFVFFFS